MYSKISLSLSGRWYNHVQASLSREAGTNRCKPLSHRELPQICTNLYLTNLKSLSYSKLVPICTNLYINKRPVQICTNLSLTVSWYRYVQQKSLSHKKPLQIRINLSLTVSWYKLVPYKSLSLSPAAGTNMCKSLSYSKLVQL